MRLVDDAVADHLRVAQEAGGGSVDLDVRWRRLRAVRDLERECGSWARLGAGLVCWLLGVVAVACLAGACWSGAAPAGRVLLGLLAPAFGIVAALLGRAVWRAGREVVDAFCWWVRLDAPPASRPASRRASRLRAGVGARIFILRGTRMVRVAVGVLALLSPAGFVMLAAVGGPRYQPTWDEEHPVVLAVSVIGLAIDGLVAGVVTFGGQVRANAAVSTADDEVKALYA